MFASEFREGMGDANRAPAVRRWKEWRPQGWTGAPGRTESQRATQGLLLRIQGCYTMMPGDTSGIAGKCGLQQVGSTQRGERPRDNTSISASETEFLSRPSKEVPGPGDDANVRIKDGEFILGYLNEYGGYPSTPAVSPLLDKSDLLPWVRALEQKDLGRNGSYVVFRKLRQLCRSLPSLLRFTQFPREPRPDGC